MENYEKAVNLLKKYKQDKILKQLEKDKSEDLQKQILSIDFEKVEDIKKEIKSLKRKDNSKDIIEKIKYVDSANLSKKEKEEYEEIGNKVIKQGKYAVVTMAGGQRNKTWT